MLHFLWMQLMATMAGKMIQNIDVYFTECSQYVIPFHTYFYLNNPVPVFPFHTKQFLGSTHNALSWVSMVFT